MSPWLFAVARAGCESPDAMIEALEMSVLEGRFDEAEALGERLVAAFGCGPLAEPEDVARIWLTEALILSAREEHAQSDLALASAARVSPSTWNTMYGPGWQQRWATASQRTPVAPGRVDIGALPAGFAAAVDGTVVAFPAILPPGLHLLQVMDDRAVTALRFDLPPGMDLVLRPELPVVVAPVALLPVAAPPTPVGRSSHGHRIVHALAVGGASALVYGASFGTRAAYRGEPSEGLRTVNNGLVVTSAGLGLTSGALLIRAATSTRP